MKTIIIQGFSASTPFAVIVKDGATEIDRVDLPETLKGEDLQREAERQTILLAEKHLIDLYANMYNDMPDWKIKEEVQILGKTYSDETDPIIKRGISRRIEKLNTIN